MDYCTLHTVDFPLFLVATANATLPSRLEEPEKCRRLGAWSDTELIIKWLDHCSELTQVGQACLHNQKRAQKSARGKWYKVNTEAIIYIIILIGNFILHCVPNQCHVHLIVNFQKQNCKVSMYKFLLQKKKTLL